MILRETKSIKRRSNNILLLKRGGGKMKKDEKKNNSHRLIKVYVCIKKLPKPSL